MTIVNPDVDPGARQRKNKKSTQLFFYFQPENCNANVHTKIVGTSDKKRLLKLLLTFNFNLKFCHTVFIARIRIRSGFQLKST
jgi:hypothetical protein